MLNARTIAVGWISSVLLVASGLAFGMAEMSDHAAAVEAERVQPAESVKEI
ncbi:MAG: hypothetical protein RIB45_09695 [Marivibrio sp.]|uniref:hypothetical protein n=1 Tax=Marivibrio sp. TaxID=2039719 RepID=UPI0032EE0408